MAITYTQVDPSVENFQDAWPANQWDDYDIFTNHGIPKGAVVEIVATNSSDIYSMRIGVRTDGSALDRRPAIHEAEDGGVTTWTWLVTVHSGTGYIEINAGHTSYVTFYIMGYWEGVTFTETWTHHDVALADQNTWVSENFAECDASTVAMVNVYNPNDSNARIGGIRATGSALNRYIDIHEAEPSWYNGFLFPVKLDASKNCEVYAEQYQSLQFYCQGFFDATLDFTEAWTQYTVTLDSTWESNDLSAVIGADGDVTWWILAHNRRNAETQIGARDGGSVHSRFIDEHEAETDGYTGLGCSVVTDTADGTVDLYCEEADNDYFWFAGYFPSTAGVTTSTSTSTSTTSTSTITSITTSTSTSTTSTSTTSTTSTSTTSTSTTSTSTTSTTTSTTSTTAPPLGQLGVIPLDRFNVYDVTQHMSRLEGFFETASERDQLRELCLDATSASVLYLVGGGVAVADSSAGKMLVQYFTFQEDQYLEGFYIITGWNYAPQVGWPNYYPWVLDLVFIGTRGQYLDGYVLGVIDEEVNDWET